MSETLNGHDLVGTLLEVGTTISSTGLVRIVGYDPGGRMSKERFIVQEWNKVEVQGRPFDMKVREVWRLKLNDRVQ
jgi:hypothetical protein